MTIYHAPTPTASPNFQDLLPLGTASVATQGLLRLTT